MNGTLFAGTEVTAGETIGQVQNAWFAQCSMGNPVDAVALGTWPIVVASDPASPNEPIAAELRGVSLMVTSPGTAPYACQVLVQGNIDILIHMGPTAGFNGRIEVDTSSGALTTQALDGFGNPTSMTCGGHVLTGDLWGMDAHYHLTSSADLGHS